MKKTTKRFALMLAMLMLALTFASCAAAPNEMWDGEGNENDPNYNYPFGGTQENEAVGGDDSLLDGDLATDYIPLPDAPTVQENPFIDTAKDNVSTFSADVDTASYSYFRSLVNAGYKLDTLKNAATSFRTEEFFNYFHYEVEGPAEDNLFGIKAEIVSNSANDKLSMLRLTLQAETPVENTRNNLVFLIDVSGSMSAQNKLPLLKTAFSYLVENLTAEDTVSIVTYSGKEEIVLDGCSGADSSAILTAVNSLKASGSTNGEAGLTEAYRVAEKHFIADGNNRIIMASDGDLNVGISSVDGIKSYIEDKRDAGIYMSVLGFGSGNYRDSMMETIADNGNGVYYYIDGTREAEKVFGTDLLGTLYTVAEDVKLQLTFDPDYVSAYRLIGYENRILNDEDFSNDSKDAGDVGAGHQVTVCYEVHLTDAAIESIHDTDKTASWLRLDVRYKKTGETLSRINEYLVGSGDFVKMADDDMMFIFCLQRTVRLLRHIESGMVSLTTGYDSLGHIIDDLNALDLSAYPERAEFRDLLEKIN